MHRMYLVLGDWSRDGHGISYKIIIESNKSVEEIQEAYKASCKLTGVSFNINNDFTGIKRSFTEAKDYHIASAYMQGFELSDLAKSALLKHGYDYDKLLESYSNSYEDDKIIFTHLWLEFVRLNLPDLVCTIIEEDPYPVINGFWNKNLNVQFAYGLFE